MATTFQRLSEMLTTDYPLPAGAVTLQATLRSLDIDSLEAVELMWRIEDMFQLTLPARSERLDTVADVVRFIDSLVAGQGTVAERPSRSTASPRA